MLSFDHAVQNNSSRAFFTIGDFSKLLEHVRFEPKGQASPPKLCPLVICQASSRKVPTIMTGSAFGEVLPSLFGTVSRHGENLAPRLVDVQLGNGFGIGRPPEAVGLRCGIDQVVTLEQHIRELVLAAFREALPEIRAELARPRMLPIKEAPVAYRAILEAEKRGELKVYRVGHASLVDEAELHAWIRRAGSTLERPDDEAERIIELNSRRRR